MIPMVRRGWDSNGDGFVSHPLGMVGAMEEATPMSPWFSRTCLALARACEALGVAAPGFRSPPSMPGVDRTLRRVPGSAVPVVVVRLRGRSRDAIRGDLIEGVVAASADALPAGVDEARLRAVLEEVVPLAAAAGSQAA